MPEFDVRLKRPTEKQLLFLRSSKKRRIIRAGRRGGKTTGMAIFAVEQFLRGHRILYAVPTSDQLTKFWFEVKRALRFLLEQGVFVKNETEHYIEKPGTQQRIRAKTAWNADTLRGDFADVLILDEWQLMDEEAWGTVGAPMLLDNNGDAIFIYTPPSLKSRSTSKARDPQHARKMYEKAVKDPERWFHIHFSSHDNPHLSKAGLEEITQDMTRVAYKQEIMAEDIREMPGALWKQDMIDELRLDAIPEKALPLKRIVIGVDPSGSSTTEVGIIAAGLGQDDEGYVIADRSMLAPSPRNWAAKVVSTYDEFLADRVIGETNFGGDMVESTIRAEDPDNRVAYKETFSSRGKMVRAEPICARYEHKQIHHVGPSGDFAALEEEMTFYVPGGDSPNRMDALVFALTELMGGTHVYGLMAWEQGEENQMREKEKKIVSISRAQNLAKPMVPGEAPRCPECKSPLVAAIGAQKRCNQCGFQWWPNGRPSVSKANRNGTDGNRGGFAFDA